jgi:hypothetical protein
MANYANDPTISAFDFGEDLTAPKKSPMSGRRQDLQPDAEYSPYSLDPTINAFNPMQAMGEVLSPEPTARPKGNPYVGEALMKMFQLRQGAQATGLSALDVPLSFPAQFGGGLTYGGALMGGATPERAQEISEYASKPLSYLQPGNLANLTDRQIGQGTASYEASPVSQVLELINKYGAQPAMDMLISRGMSPQSAHHLVANAPLLIGGGVKLGKIGLQEVRKIPSYAAELKTPEAPRIEPQMDVNQTPQPQMTGMGAASTANKNAVQQAIAEAHPSLQAELTNRDPASFSPQDLKAIEIHNKFAKVDPELEHPASIPTEGQALQDVAKLSDEYNNKALPGNEELRAKFETRDPFLIKGFNNVKNDFAPSHSGVGQQGKANNILEDIKTNHVDVDNANIKKAYSDLNDTNGNFAVDMQQAAKNALSKVEQLKRTNRIPREIKETLDAYADGTYQGSGIDFENLRTDLASDTRKAQKANDGTTVKVLSDIRDAIEELPMKGPEAIAFKEKADLARSLFKNQKELLDPKSSKYNKAYAMAEDDNRTPTERLTLQHPAADKFFENFIVGKQATPADLNRMIDLVGKDSPAHHELIAGIADHLQKKAGVVDGKGNISQKALNDELTKLGPRLDLIAGPEAANRLRLIGEVASLTEHVRNRGGGSANVSQTATTQAREAELKAQKDFAAGIVEAGANIATGGKSGIVASVLAPIFKARQERQAAEAAEAARQERLRKTLSRSAGIQPKD